MIHSLSQVARLGEVEFAPNKNSTRKTHNRRPEMHNFRGLVHFHCSREHGWHTGKHNAGEGSESSAP